MTADKDALLREEIPPCPFDDLPLRWHEPADYQEAVEMLRRARREINKLTAALAGQDDCVRVPRSLVEELHEYFAQDMYSGGGWYFADKRREEIAALLAAAKEPK